MTMSVQWAPLALMALKAACPGVSRNVTHSPFAKDTDEIQEQKINKLYTTKQQILLKRIKDKQTQHYEEKKQDTQINTDQKKDWK